MGVPNRTGRRIGVTGSIIACLVLCVDQGRAEEFRFESTGLRGGLSANGGRNEFHQLESFANWFLPWGWDLGKEWNLQTRLDSSGGWLGDSSQNAAVFTLGPTVILKQERWPVSLEGGVSPTMLTSYTFENKDLGMYFQFTSHVGLNWDFAKHWRLSYRFQHMSNADLAASNPGLNMHMLGLSYLF
jgi:hypothetical protein